MSDYPWWRTGQLCQCGHPRSRHVKSSTDKLYCIDCPCGDFSPVVVEGTEQ